MIRESGLFDVIYADPPWRYEAGTAKRRSQEIEAHYPTMTTPEIQALRIPAAPSSVLYLWTTSPKLEDGLAVMKAWGFKYRSSAVWDKGGLGLGYWFRINHEFLLVGIKGSHPATPKEARIPSVLREKKREHSRKPDRVYELIEKSFPGESYLELFARTARPGWSAWGNQIGLFTAPAPEGRPGRIRQDRFI